jgi:hypothetical protein
MKFTMLIVFALCATAHAAPADFAGTYRDIDSEVQSGRKIEVTPLNADQSAFKITLYWTSSGRVIDTILEATVDPSKPACNPSKDIGCSRCTYEKDGYDIDPSKRYYETIKCVSYLNEKHHFPEDLVHDEFYREPRYNGQRFDLFLRNGDTIHGKELARLKRTP